LIVFVAGLSFFLEYSSFKRDSVRIKEVMIQKKKYELKNLVKSSINSIEILREDLDLKLKKDLKDNIKLAYDVACNIYKTNKDSKSSDEIKEMIKQALRPVVFFNGRGYYFIVSTDGVDVLNPPNPESEGTSIINRKDSKGNFPMQDIKSLLETKNEGYVSYYWTQPKDSKLPYLKTAFVKKLPFYNLVIGSGDYISFLDKELKDRALRILRNIRYDEGGYIFVNSFDGTVINTFSSVFSNGDNIKDHIDRKGHAIFKDQYRESMMKDGGFFSYNWFDTRVSDYRDKIGYVKSIPEWEWIVGGFVDETLVDQVIKASEDSLYSDYKRRLIYVSLVVFFAMLIAFLLSRYLRLQIDNIFEHFIAELEDAVSKRRLINIDSLRVREFQILGESTNRFLKKQQEVFNKLENSEQKFRLLIKNLPVMILGVDSEQKVTVFNKAAQKFFGRRSSAMMGKVFSLNEFFEDDVTERIREKIRNNKNQFTVESYCTKEGAVFSHVWSMFEIAEGEMMYVGYDITQRIAKETIINNQKLLLETLIDTMPIPIFYKRLDGVYEGCNKAYAEFLDVSKSDIIGHKVEQLFSEDEKRLLMEKDAELIENKGVQIYETVFKEKSGINRYGRMFKALYHDNSGEEIGILGIAFDVTESVNYSHKLEESNSTKDRFFSIIAHDLKNPFNSVLGILEILREDYDDLDDDTRKEYLTVLGGTSNRLYRLLTNLLDWSRAQTNSIQFSPVRLNMSELVEETLHVLVVQAKNKGLNLIFDFEKDVVFTVDENMMSSVVRNLVNNAIKFTPKGGEVRVIMNKTEEGLDITVQDTGVGMTQEVLNKLFKIEEKHSTVGTNNEVGTGLGLILCKEFVEKHKGTLVVSSVEEKGSEFFISIPN